MIYTDVKEVVVTFQSSMKISNSEITEQIQKHEIEGYKVQIVDLKNVYIKPINKKYEHMYLVKYIVQ